MNIESFEAFKDKTGGQDWRVEAVDVDSGDCFVAIFCGSQAEARAKMYADWMNSPMQEFSPKFGFCPECGKPMPHENQRCEASAP